MLFNLEMISYFLSDYDINVQVGEDRWKIKSFQIGPIPTKNEESTLYIFEEGTSVICANGENRIFVRNGTIGDIVNRIITNFAFYNDWERRALNAVATDQQLSEYMSLMSELFPGYTIKFLDALGRVHYSTNPEDSLPQPLDPFVMTLIRNIPTCHKISLGINGITTFWSKHFNRQYLYGNFVFPNGSYIIFSIFCTEQFPKPFGPVQTHLGQLAQSVFQRANITNLEQSGLTANRNFIMHLLDGQTITATDYRDLETALGWSVVDGAHLIVIENTPGDGFAARALPYSISRGISASFTFNYQDYIVCLLPNADFRRNLRKLSDMLIPISFRGGISLPFSSWTEIPHAYHQAMISIPKKTNPAQPLQECINCLWDYYVELLNEHGGSRLLHPDISCLIANSPAGSTALLDTLYCYLRNNCSMVTTAAELNLHINTLKYRMGKIRDIITFDPDDYESRMAFLISCDLYHASKLV